VQSVPTGAKFTATIKGHSVPDVAEKSLQPRSKGLRGLVAGFGLLLLGKKWRRGFSWGHFVVVDFLSIHRPPIGDTLLLSILSPIAYSTMPGSPTWIGLARGEVAATADDPPNRRCFALDFLIVCPWKQTCLLG